MPVGADCGADRCDVDGGSGPDEDGLDPAVDEEEDLELFCCCLYRERLKNSPKIAFRLPSLISETKPKQFTQKSPISF